MFNEENIQNGMRERISPPSLAHHNSSNELILPALITIILLSLTFVKVTGSSSRKRRIVSADFSGPHF